MSNDRLAYRRSLGLPSRHETVIGDWSMVNKIECPDCGAVNIDVLGFACSHERCPVFLGKPEDDAPPKGRVPDHDFLIMKLRGLALRMHGRLLAIEDRDGKSGAVTGPGIGVGYLLVKDIAKALSDAADAVESRSTPRPNDKIRELRNRISNRLNNRLCEMTEGVDDSIVGFNDAWDIVRIAFDEAIGER